MRMFNVTPSSTTMIGSMPYDSPEKAFSALSQHPLSIPTWCQLPKQSFKETMVPQYSEGFPGIVIDENEKKTWVQLEDGLLNEIAAFYENFIAENLDAFAISEIHAAGLHRFLKTLESSGEKLPLIKGQITGPFTFGLTLNDQDMKPVWFNPEYKDVVLKGLTMKALWQLEQLQKYAENAIIFFDEPILSALGTPTYISIEDDEVIESLNELIHAVQAKGAAAGIHCCGNMDWGLLTKTDVDIIAFDAYFYGEKVALYPEEIQAFLNKGGYLAWGIVPTAGHTADAVPVDNETEESLRKRLNELIALFASKGIPEELLRKQLILTPSCGLGTLPPDAADKALELLQSLS